MRRVRAGRYLSVVTGTRDLAHLRRLGARLTEQEEQDRAEAARQDPGEKILVGLRMGSAFARHHGYAYTDEPPLGVQLLARWRALHARD